MQALLLDHNNLNSLPSNIGSLNKLEMLVLSNNPIVELPKSISKLKNLKTLVLTNTNISEVDIKNIQKALPNCTIIQ